MRRIIEISDDDLGLKTEPDAKLFPRTAARTILKKGNLIALLKVSKHNYYKLPGGGVDEGETIEEALKREVLEETGCSFRIIGEVGEIIEHRNQENQIQTSHCFIADVEKEGAPHFTEEELQDGFELVWVTLENAMNLVKNSKPDNYYGKFIVKRDLEFLKQAQKYFK